MSDYTDNEIEEKLIESGYKLSDLILEAVIKRTEKAVMTMANLKSELTDEYPGEDYDVCVPVNVGNVNIGYFSVKELEERRRPAVAGFLASAGGMLADMAYAKFVALQAAKGIENATSMKSSFLANMSHEIRTPMNAVIGMAEVALRENLSDNAREYLGQIKNSGRSLLHIINDILDYSKLESGKMELSEVEYEPLSLFNDVVNLAATKLKGKNVEMTLEVSPDFPASLYGDNLKIRQTMVNLVSNAVKFTKEGRIRIVVDYEKQNSEEILLKVSIKDTGIGIREEDKAGLFESFTQVDSKRNRDIEGTGLGLAISGYLVELMGGKIGVTSEFGKGSEFYFAIPQKVCENKHVIAVKNPEDCFAIGCFDNIYLSRTFVKEANRLNVMTSALVNTENIDVLLDIYHDAMKNKKTYLFIEEGKFNREFEKKVAGYPDITVVVLTEVDSKFNPLGSNVVGMRKPLSTLNIAMALNNEEMIQYTNENTEDVFDFVAPDAHILIVDDNAVNLTVAEGLIEPLKLKIHAATSGRQALKMIENNSFDIVFMDHMMPDLDGIETTKLIRSKFPQYAEMPVVALTANSQESTRSLFTEAGMNDYVAKPIEVRTFVSKIKQWLPDNKIIKNHKSISEGMDTGETGNTSDMLIIGDLDVEKAVALLGSEKVYLSVLKEYYRTISSKASLIEDCFESWDWKTYTIEVHALKSASRQIGALELSDMAANLEKAGNEVNILEIRKNTPALLARYRSYISILAPFCEEEKTDVSDKKAANSDEIGDLIVSMREAIDNLDMDEMERLVKKFDGYSYEGRQKELMAALLEAVSAIDVDSCESILAEWENMPA